jgi:peptidoglycan/xylan/chitin deacetylase (PgdA/CDA1 family)
MKKPVLLGIIFLVFLINLLFFGYEWKDEFSASINYPGKNVTAAVVAPRPAEPVSNNRSIADARTILERSQVPILCYHQIREWRSTDSKTARDYIVPVEIFREQMKMLSDSGYNTISPDQLYDYLTKGEALPAKPIMITYDDTDLEQYTEALPEMNKYGFKGVYFIMTVSIGRPNYMSREQVKTLSDQGHTIGSHTWDHQNVKKYVENDWKTQVEKPSKQLEAITGKTINYFAYPFGLWNEAAIPQLKNRNIKASFQLSGKRDQNDPLYSIRRIIVPGSWSAATLNNRIKTSFR